MSKKNTPLPLPVTGAVPPPGHLAPLDHLPQLREALLRWFAIHGRDLPWRRTYTPYEVWISEVMLQQTQMDRGVSYFLRWMERFPTPEALAAASEEEVLHAWEGLGYYSRARNLLAAARRIRDVHGGRFPRKREDIAALPGVGPYTTAAIASIAFEQPVACVDANVERVIARVFDVDAPVKEKESAARIAALAQQLLPPDQARAHNQAMMELGALICGRKARCEACPLADFCQSRHLGIVHERPVPGRRADTVLLDVVTGVLRHEGRIFVQKRCDRGAWGGLWEFPGGRVEPGEEPRQAVEREHQEETGFAVQVTDTYGIIRHGYTTYRVTLHCFGVALTAGTWATDDDGLPVPPVLTAASTYRWASPQELQTLAMPAAHRKLADRLFAAAAPAQARLV